MDNLRNSIDALWRVVAGISWIDFAKNSTVILSFFTINFASYIYFFSSDLFSFVTPAAFGNHIFQISVLWALSFGLSKLLIFFIERYFLNFINNMVIISSSVLALPIAALYRLTGIGSLKKLGENVLSAA